MIVAQNIEYFENKNKANDLRHWLYCFSACYLERIGIKLLGYQQLQQPRQVRQNLVELDADDQHCP